MGLVCTIANIYVLIVVARAISTFFPISSGSPFLPVVDFLYKATEPVFTPIRRVLPTMGPLISHHWWFSLAFKSSHESVGAKPLTPLALLRDVSKG